MRITLFITWSLIDIGNANMKIKTNFPRLFSSEFIVQQHHNISYEVLLFFYNIKFNILYDTLCLRT